MRERIGRSDLRQFVARAPAEGPAGRGHEQAADLGVGAGGERLRDGGVLAVHGDETPGGGRAGDQLPADDQGLLVRQREHGVGAEDR